MKEQLAQRFKSNGTEYAYVDGSFYGPTNGERLGPQIAKDSALWKELCAAVLSSLFDCEIERRRETERERPSCQPQDCGFGKVYS